MAVNSIDLSKSAAKVKVAMTADESFAASFGLSKNDIREVKLIELIPYSNGALGYDAQPFRMYTLDRLRELAADITYHGILNPLIVRPFEGGYQILSGHNRAEAAKLAGLTTVPVMVKEIDDDAAAMIVVNSNLLQREKLLHSEKAFAYKLRLEAMKRQAGRPKNNLSQIETDLSKKRTDEVLADEVGESRAQIARYIRLTELIPELLSMVDDEALPMNAGVNLSYLPKPTQKEILQKIREHGIDLSIKMAEELKQLGDGITENDIDRVLFPAAADETEVEDLPAFEEDHALEFDSKPSEQKHEKLKSEKAAAIPWHKRELKISVLQLAPYFDEGTPDTEMIDGILKALENSQEIP